MIKICKSCGELFTHYLPRFSKSSTKQLCDYCLMKRNKERIAKRRKLKLIK
jgi:formylmethanofuran dehydrogenase subunit E